MFRALNNLTDKEYFWRHHIFCIDIGNGFDVQLRTNESDKMCIFFTKIQNYSQ